MKHEDFLTELQLARHCLDIGQFTQAQSRYLTVLQLGNNVAVRILSMLGAGYASLGLGAYAEACNYHQDAFDLCVAERNPPQSVVSTCHHALGQSYISLGHLTKAKNHLKTALKIRISLVGERHPLSLSTLHLYGLLHHRLGQTKRAFKIVRRCLEMRKEVLRQNHPDVIASIQALAQIHYAIEDYGLSLRLYRKALRLTVINSERSSLDKAAIMNAMGQTLQRLNREKEASQLLILALKIFSRLLGSCHPDVASVLQNLATVRVSREPVRSLYFAQKAHAIFFTCLGPAHLRTAASAISVAQVFQRLGKLQQALELVTDAYQCQLQSLEKSHPEVVKTRQLAKSLAAQISEPAARVVWACVVCLAILCL